MPDELYHRRLGDRKDGRLLRSLSPFYRMMPYIMVRRSDACNQFSDLIEISGAEAWILEKRRANWQPREPKVKTGYLARYASMVTSGNRGAILEIPTEEK